MKKYKVTMFGPQQKELFSATIEAENTKDAKRRFRLERADMGAIFWKNPKNWVGVKRIR